MNNTRQAGVLMPLASLPSRCGVGDFGKASYEFADILHEMGASIWQILPLNPLGYGNSPYQPYSSFAGDPLYISLEKLWEDGLLDQEPEAFGEDSASIDYQGARAHKEPYLRRAFTRFVPDENYEEFASQDWVYQYAVFITLKNKNGGVCWLDWEEDDRNWIQEQKGDFPEELEEEIQYQMFLQYTFFCQWMELKSYVNGLGIRVMGDLPFYVGLDSLDVWANAKNFLLDENFRPTYIAGVPPDYFSPTGQRWGNPIYDWDYMKEQNYRFWVERIGYNSKLFDIIRIDHFRAFDTFWKIPASCPTAMEGEWIEAPGYEVIDTLKKEIPGVNLAAEDLGDLRPEVLTLRDHYHLKGMKILVFSIETGGKYAYDSQKDRENMIFYTGTHDNDTLMEWYGKLTVPARRKVRRFLKRAGCKNGPVKERLLAYLLGSRAEYAILPMADVLGMGAEGHINTPGTVGSPNWEWRMPSFEAAEKALKKYGATIFCRETEE